MNIETVDLNADLADLVANWPMIKVLAPGPAPRFAVIGCYQGRVIELLATLWPDYAAIVGWDPQMWAIERARARLAGRERITLNPWGLGVRDETVRLHEFGTDAAGVARTTRESGHGRLHEALGELLPLLPLDVVIVNIEGGEYELLPYLNDTGLWAGVGQLAVQFHRGLGNDARHDELLVDLDLEFTRRDWDEQPAWVAWGR